MIRHRAGGRGQIPDFLKISIRLDPSGKTGVWWHHPQYMAGPAIDAMQLTDAGKASEATSRIALARQVEVRSVADEINVQTLVAATKRTQALAVQIFEVDAPSPFRRQVGRKVVLGARAPLANAGNILPDFGRKDVDVL
ncbi:hypothetical protein JQ621_13850 [Bradyrhizobium manausense]|uniref:hypothetical protein n=1 Tax=Bradyrhizobium manausense TaxID=989370 RepID=UPI001BAD0AE5|nr:hypothetical protein [Bradyrhizobium manausense]MBR1088550.1 hypothetical protein [Bradyrhizobium manausense]